MLSRAKAVYRKLIRTGITEDLSFSESLRIELCNMTIICALPLISIFLIYNVFVGISIKQNIIIGLIWITIDGIALTLNYFKRYFLAKLFVITTSLFYLAGLHFLFGAAFRPESMYLLMVLSSCYFFNGRWAFIMSLLVVLTYSFIHYIHLSTPAPIAHEMVPHVPLFYFAFSIIFVVALTSRLLLETARYNRITTTQNQVLEEKNEALKRFSYIASHDLKSPLRIMVSFSELAEIELQRDDKAKAIEYLQFVKSNGKDMATLIEDILEVTKINNNTPEKKAWVDLNRIVRKVILILRQEIEEKDAIVNIGDLPLFYCNETRFIILFQNLIQNGIKYNRSSVPSVNIHSKIENNQIYIYFKDNGIGIDPKYHEQIFEYFKRLHNKSQYSGTGIGLGLCKKIIHNYNGRITIDSTLGKGTTFTIELPFKATNKIDIPSETLTDTNA